MGESVVLLVVDDVEGVAEACVAEIACDRRGETRADVLDERVYPIVVEHRKLLHGLGRGFLPDLDIVHDGIPVLVQGDLVWADGLVTATVRSSTGSSLAYRWADVRAVMATSTSRAPVISMFSNAQTRASDCGTL